ncbi:hypothetical protein C4544_01070 [candidate division WS5 bacterium]|uniref:SH3b domain-containing protein n=1 Tax=candidate division WS5 bacterium TaxID=2093353 RepID=A0A419DG20_9BACT|nr:MAG: hypothetical protein C4544_01070 [candidate division WS5 bacterium]
MAKKEDPKDKIKKEGADENEALEDIVEEEKEAETEGKEQDYNSIFDEDYVDDSDEKEADEDPEEEKVNEAESDSAKASSDKEDKEGKQTKEESKDSSSNKSSNKKKEEKTKKAESKKDKEDNDPQDEITLHEKPQKEKKGFPTKKALIALAVILALLAGAFGGYLYFKSTNTQKEETKKEEPKTEEPKEETPTGKTVYVTSEGGLNMRKEPDSTSEVIAVIPNGTKLDVLKEQGEWYKVKYEGKEGWIWKGYTSEESPLVYKNEEYGFQLTFPSNWSNYKVVKKDIDNGDGTTAPTFYVGIKVSNANSESVVGKGYADMFAISALTNDQWASMEAGEGPKPAYITKSSKYVFTWSPSQAGPDEVLDEREEVQGIIDTFKLL